METGRIVSREIISDIRKKYFEESLKKSELMSDGDMLEYIKKTFTISEEVKLARYITAKYILRKYNIITDFRTDIMKAYDTKKMYYRDIGEEIIKTFLTENIDIHNTKMNSQEIIHLLKTITYIDDEKIKKAHSDEQIPFKNGVLDLRDMSFSEHDPKFLFEHQIPIIYDKSVKCVEVPIFLNEICKKEDIYIIYDIFGLALYPKNILEKFFVFTGTGSNGKSKLINLCEFFIGEENSSSISLKQLTEDKFSVARTYKKLLNVGADIGGQIIRDTSMLKAASASDRISGQFKFGQIFDFTPSALQVFSANDPPIFEDSSEGMYRRCETILFPNKFGNDEDMKEDKNCKKADPKILEKLKSCQEMTGLANIAVEHLINIIKNGQLSVVKSTIRLKTDYIKYSDNVKSFIEEKCEEDEYIPAEYDNESKVKTDVYGFLTVGRLYEAYCLYCDENKLVKKSKDGFSKRLKKIDSWNLDFGLLDFFNGKKERSVRGIKFKYQQENSSTDYGGANTPNTQNTPNTPLLSLNVYKKNDINFKKGKAVFGVSPELGVFAKHEETKETPKFDNKLICYQKCQVADCHEVECNFDSRGIPYCHKHWEMKAN